MVFGFRLWGFRVFVCRSLCKFSRLRSVSHLRPRFRSAGRSFWEALDNIHPILVGHGRGMPLGSGILGLASVRAEARCLWWGVHCEFCL